MSFGEDLDDALRECIRRNPNCVSVKYRFKVNGARGHYECYPLQRAVAIGASLDVIQTMYEIFPAAVREIDSSSNTRSTPLHAACCSTKRKSRRNPGSDKSSASSSSSRSRLDVIKFLLSEYPDAAKVRTKYGYTPLHNACEYYYDVNGVNNEVEEAAAAAAEDGSSGTPPTAATSSSAADASSDDDELLELIRLLVEAYPKALSLRNRLGKTPYETALRNKHVAARVLDYLKAQTAKYHSKIQKIQHLVSKMAMKIRRGSVGGAGAATIASDHFFGVSRSGSVLSESSCPATENMSPSCEFVHTEQGDRHGEVYDI